MTVKPQSLSPMQETAQPDTETVAAKPLEEPRKPALSKSGPLKLAPIKGSVANLEKSRNFTFRRQMALLTKANLKVLADDVQNPAKPGVDAFCNILRRRFGSVSAAWRVALDPDNKARLSFNEFVNVARNVGYCNNLKLLWTQLDADGSGFISLNELDPEAAEMLDSFKALLIKKYGSTLRAWRQMDIDKNDRLDVHELEQRCKELGWEGNARKLFFSLKTDVSRSFLTLADVDQQAFVARLRGDHNMMLAKQTASLTQVKSAPSLVSPAGASPKSSSMLITAPSEPALRPISSMGSSGRLQLTMGEGEDEKDALAPTPERRKSGETSNSKWTQQQSLELIEARRERREKANQKDMGVKCVDGLKKLLLTRYGTYYSAWKQALDFDGNERLSFGEFCLALRELGFTGNAKAAWHSLDTDKDGFIELGDIDEKTATEINAYRNAVKEKYGHMLAGWLQGLSKDGHSPVDEKTFVRHCKDLEYPYDCSALFHNLKNDSGRKYMTLNDYDIPASNAFTRGDMQMISEPSASSTSKKPSELDFHGRNEASFRIRWNRVQSKLQRNELHDVHEKDRESDMAASDFASFKRLLIRKYGTITAAWKHHLDPDGNGRLSFGEFCEALRKVGYSGSKKHLWIELDTEKSGFVKLDNIDKKASECLTHFRKFMADKFGTWLKLWNALDVNRNARVDEDEFIEIMPTLGYELDPKPLFKYLLDRPGITFLSMADLDPSAASEYYRGPDVDKRRELEKMSIKEKERLKGAQSFEQLKKTLKAKYGTITSAWKHALDADGNGRLSFVEFCQALQAVGFIGNIKEMFHNLDADASGYISLEELDPEAAEATSTFRKLVLDKYGNFIEAWKVFDIDKNGALDRDEFTARVKELGYEGNCHKLFKYYLDKPGCKTLQLSDLDAEAGREQYRNQQRNDAKAHRNKLQAEQEERKKHDKGISDVAGLKEKLKGKFGSIVAAWKHHLDKGRNGRISFVEFCNSMRDIGFQGSLKTLWKELDWDMSGFITLDELDPEANKALTEFRALVIERHGNFLAAWKVMDANGSNTLELDEFIGECAKLGYQGDPKKLFKWLLDKPGLKYLTLHDLDHEAAREEYRDPGRHDVKARREAMKSTWEAEKAKITGATDVESFKKLLVKKFGTITAAWQHGLDMDGSGKLSFNEFCEAARALAYAGNVKELWKKLDDDNSGLISLEELAPKAYNMLKNFKTFVNENFSSYHEAWVSMDSRNKKMISEDDFNSWCSGLGFQAPPELFKNLLDKPASKFLKEDFFQSPFLK